MDSLSSSSPSNLDITSLSPSDRREVEQFLQAQSTQVAINKIVHDLTDTCWKKCVGRSPARLAGSRLSATEEGCASNCVARWLGAQTAVLEALGSAAGRGEGSVTGSNGGGESFGSGGKKGWFS